MNSSITPNHVGIIMDGNGRWAERNGLHRTKGHASGLKVTKAIVAHVARSPIQNLSLYTFSTENWTRTQEEVGALMDLIATHLKAQIPFYNDYGIRIVHSGSKLRLTHRITDDLAQIEEMTANNRHLTLNLLIDYSSQEEITRAMQRLIEQHLPITQENIERNLDQPSLPKIDCVIRTAGEKRLSNFMLWQSAYAEFIYTDTLWPDFTALDFDQAMEEYSHRHRTFGG
ncbi:polyprenyl diphosphate synthase [Entomospira nematocerorum]|uniref:polyprenyl diphosphate synthase n=1 Tax=Entomospira nematocerorum TaxID=2719987 RepID=UPI001FE5FF5F|nr:polyprenyl diphosphate synthase [Entomospira nematocera]WDI33900.1 polyprenyl diphosphate synthase [Entomospira nematocera]